jgi:hypothetical protein
VAKESIWLAQARDDEATAGGTDKIYRFGAEDSGKQPLVSGHVLIGARRFYVASTFDKHRNLARSS